MHFAFSNCLSVIAVTIWLESSYYVLVRWIIRRPFSNIYRQVLHLLGCPLVATKVFFILFHQFVLAVVVIQPSLHILHEPHLNNPIRRDPQIRDLRSSITPYPQEHLQ